MLSLWGLVSRFLLRSCWCICGPFYLQLPMWGPSLTSAYAAPTRSCEVKVGDNECYPLLLSTTLVHGEMTTDCHFLLRGKKNLSLPLVLQFFPSLAQNVEEFIHYAWNKEWIHFRREFECGIPSNKTKSGEDLTRLFDVQRRLSPAPSLRPPKGGRMVLTIFQFDKLGWHLIWRMQCYLPENFLNERGFRTFLMLPAVLYKNYLYL